MVVDLLDTPNKLCSRSWSPHTGNKLCEKYENFLLGCLALIIVSFLTVLVMNHFIIICIKEDYVLQLISENCRGFEISGIRQNIDSLCSIRPDSKFMSDKRDTRSLPDIRFHL